MSSFHFNNGSHCSTVVRVAPSHYLEVRRNDITWSMAFRAAHPDIKQHSWHSLAMWHKSLPLTDPGINAWKKARGWSIPASSVRTGAGGDTLIRLSPHMTYVMNAHYATEIEVFDAIMELSIYNPDSPYLKFLLGNPFEAISEGDILGALWEQGHIMEEEEKSIKPATTKVPLLRPSDLLPVKKERSDSDMDTDEAAPAPTPVLEVVEVAPPLKKDSFALVEDVLAFNRRWTASRKAAKPAESVTDKKPVSINFSGVQFKEHEAEAVHVPTKPNPFAEIYALYDRIDNELLEEAYSMGYKQMLVQQFVSFCLRPAFAHLWRSNTFERIQMRATLLTWLEFTCAGEESYIVRDVINLFLTTYPV